MTELVTGPLATTDPRERASRQDVLQRIESLVDPVPFDIAASAPMATPSQQHCRAAGDAFAFGRTIS